MSYKEKGTCSINPKHKYSNWGNNAEPVNGGRCCNECNATVVLPARIYGRQFMGMMMGSAQTPAKAAAARANGKKGGRPRKK